ncbi:putative phosphatase [Desulfosporosinus acidiphilus SJ4]|uniref:Putative phosphatase n=1 Tax=Desulfosporosinus acidiphilus (strain DSM 22704 / JCM 16185 / SJ4) TaxID=646529 RepID=I4D4S6_DESAJ|nr:HAD family hydrolase [Desulfosporosinus acidiphilus]AFM40800.1 putative phosphatase [Desulfosporosinus acidiphilus SJ4]
MRYQILLWDLDGTLTDPKQGITRSVQYALQKLGFPYPHEDELEWVIGPPLMDSFRVLLETEDNDLLTTALDFYRERFREIGMFENKVYPGIPELLASLKGKGCQHFLATSKPKIFAAEILKHFSLKDYFSKIMGSELNGKFVEKEDLIREVLQGVPQELRSKTVMIGDRRYDVQGARSNHIEVISVGYGYGTNEELELAAPDYLVSSVRELERLLQN